MRYLRNFLIAMFIIFVGIALGNAALAAHSPDTRDVWLITIDYDVFGKPSVRRGFEPRPYRTPAQCMDIGKDLMELIETYQPERRFAMLCILPDDEDNVDALLDQFIEEFRPFFTPPGRGA